MSLSAQIEKAPEFYNKEGFNYNNISQIIKEFKNISINLKDLEFNSFSFINEKTIPQK